MTFISRRAVLAALPSLAIFPGAACSSARTGASHALLLGPRGGLKQRVQFMVAGSRVVGDFYTPAAPGPHPAVVVAGPMTSVKEQVTGVYACALAMRGFAALSIDHRHFGESEGQPRQYEYFAHKIEDLRAAVNWLEARDDVDGRRLGMVGVCLGAGYAAHAAAGDPRIRGFGAIAGYYRDVDDIRRRDPVDFQTKVEAGKAARVVFEATGEVITIPAAALSGDAAMTLPDTFDYYATPRAAVPNYVNRLAVMSREHFLPFDVQSAAGQLRAPFTMVHSEKALNPVWARRFFDHVTTEKTQTWVSSLGQVDFYDTPRLVADACDVVARHLERTLR